MKLGRPSVSQKKPKKTSSFIHSRSYRHSATTKNPALQLSRLLIQPVNPSSREGGQHILPWLAAAGGGDPLLHKDKMATLKCHLFSATLDATQKPPPAPGQRTPLPNDPPPPPSSKEMPLQLFSKQVLGAGKVTAACRVLGNISTFPACRWISRQIHTRLILPSLEGKGIEEA